MGSKRNAEANERVTGKATVVEEFFSNDSFKTGIADDTDFLLDTGLQVRPDTKATIYLLNKSGDFAIPPIRNFFITSINASFADRQQIMETYGGVDIVFLGEKPVQVQIGAVLYNTENLNWRDQWMYYWSKFLRGTKLAAAKRRLVVTADNLLLEGVFLNYNFSESGEQVNSVGLQVTMLCPADKIYPVKLEETMNFDIPDDDVLNVKKIVLDSLDSGDSSKHYASTNWKTLT